MEYLTCTKLKPANAPTKLFLDSQKKTITSIYSTSLLIHNFFKGAIIFSGEYNSLVVNIYISIYIYILGVGKEYGCIIPGACGAMRSRCLLVGWQPCANPALVNGSYSSFLDFLAHHVVLCAAAHLGTQHELQRWSLLKSSEFGWLNRCWRHNPFPALKAQGGVSSPKKNPRKLTQTAQTECSIIFLASLCKRGSWSSKIYQLTKKKLPWHQSAIAVSVLHGYIPGEKSPNKNHA